MCGVHAHFYKYSMMNEFSILYDAILTRSWERESESLEPKSSRKKAHKNYHGSAWIADRVAGN